MSQDPPAPPEPCSDKGNEPVSIGTMTPSGAAQTAASVKTDETTDDEKTLPMPTPTPDDKKE